jgi:type 1 glutamine amidotransferase
MIARASKLRDFATATAVVALAMWGCVFQPGNLRAQTSTNQIKILLVTGQDYPGHPWRETTPVLRKHLEQDKRFLVRVIEDPHFLASRALTNYDVILLHFMNWEQPSPGDRARQNLAAFVRGGKALVLVHFACGAWQDWPEFVELAGRVWNPKLRGHDPRGKFTVTPTSAEHPITKGLPPFETDDELYTCLDGKTPIEILVTARSKVDSKDYPMAFVLQVGKGRVFHSPLGHDAKAFDNPAVGELLRRGCAWAAGAPVSPAQ